MFIHYNAEKETFQGEWKNKKPPSGYCLGLQNRRERETKHPTKVICGYYSPKHDSH